MRMIKGLSRTETQRRWVQKDTGSNRKEGSKRRKKNKWSRKENSWRLWSHLSLPRLGKDESLWANKRAYGRI